MRITKELLIEKGACEEWVAWFCGQFPDGCEFDDEAICKAAGADTSFIWWFYTHVQQDERLYQLCGVTGSNGVNWSNGVNGSNGVSWSGGVNRSDGVNRSFGLYRCEGVSRCLFCANTTGKLMVFNKPMTESRFDEIKNSLYEKLACWRPAYNNIRALYLESGSDWKVPPVTNAKGLQAKDAWEGMPDEAVAYVKSLPEFDADIWKLVTGLE